MASHQLRRYHHRPDLGVDRRGRKPKLTRQQIAHMEAVLDEATCAEDRQYTWTSLAQEAGIETKEPPLPGDQRRAVDEEQGVSERTIRRAMQQLDYRHCIACRKTYMSPRIREARVKFAYKALDQRPQPQDWKCVRFSDEVHFGRGPQGKIHIIRKLGTRTCGDCLQHNRAPPTELDKKEKKYHAWAMIGWNYKSPLVWYEVPSNENGKMTQEVYTTQILPHVINAMQLPACGDPQQGTDRVDGSELVLEEDGDTGHTGSKAARFKRDHHINSYINAPHSPDLSPIENAWRKPKGALRAVSHFTEGAVKIEVEQAWMELDQGSINRWVMELPERLKEVIKLEGRMTGY